jgi:dihydroxy-acid dehydratase
MRTEPSGQTGLGRARGVDRRLTSYGDYEFSRYIRRAFLASAGYDQSDLSRPVVGIANTSSDYTTCHRQMPELVAAVKRGVLEAGGLPLVFPTCSLGEILLTPTSMLFRNLMAIETEELIRAQPMDSVVLLGGCDKTVPAQLMAAVSADVPALLLVAGPMQTGIWRGERLGACTDCRRLWADHRASIISSDEMVEVQENLCPTAGTCMVMGTASTMACIAEALGMMLPRGATAPATTGDRLRLGVVTGRRAVDIAESDTRPSAILTRAALRNALVVLSAISGSTNAIIHLLAIARRAGIDLALDDFDSVGREVPVLVNCKPTGTSYMEDFHRDGGVPQLLANLRPLLDLSATQADGRSLSEALLAMQSRRTETIGTLDEPIGPPGALACLKGTLAPQGAVIKVSAATPALLQHRGPACVFNSPEEAAQRLGDRNLKVTEDHILVLRNAGPVAAGMPEAGSLPIPIRLAERGVRDMVRVSDARMSGTAFGTVVLHCSPEAATGGPLSLVHDGDIIELDVANRRLDLLVPARELSQRIGAAPPRAKRGWLRLYQEHVMPAHLGADFDFLSSPSGSTS